jgi:hypothetical protein
MLLVAVSLVVGGCLSGPGAEMGFFGTSHDSEDLGQGYGGGAKLELKPISLVSIDGRASWVHYDDVNVDMIPLEVAGLLNMPLLWEMIVPYAGVGTGYYMFTGSGGDLEDETGWFPLVGLEIGFKKLSILAEARYLFLETDVKNGKGDLLGRREADLDGTAVNVGLLLRF